MSEKQRECVEPPVLPRATPYYTFSSSVEPPPENAEGGDGSFVRPVGNLLMTPLRPIAVADTETRTTRCYVQGSLHLDEGAAAAAQAGEAVLEQRPAQVVLPPDPRPRRHRRHRGAEGVDEGRAPLVPPDRKSVV